MSTTESSWLKNGVWFDVRWTSKVFSSVSAPEVSMILWSLKIPLSLPTIYTNHQTDSLESQIKDTCLTLFKLVLLRFISAEVLFIHKTSSQCPRDSKENSTLKTEFICWLWAEWKLHLEIQWKRHLNLCIIFFFLPCSDGSTKVKAYKTCKGWFGALLCFVLVLLLFLVLMMENILFL